VRCFPGERNYGKLPLIRKQPGNVNATWSGLKNEHKTHMKLPRLRTFLLAPLYLFAAFYFVAIIITALKSDSIPVLESAAEGYETVAIFGASGTAGDGILKAALSNPDIDRILVVTRRTTPRIEEGIAAGKLQMILHMDYLDYTAIRDKLTALDAVYWAIGTSSFGVDEKTYGMIHVDFPVRFVSEWISVGSKPGSSFHYISSSDISEDSSMMWAREKVRAEKSLFELAESTNLRVIAYRPDYIGPTEEEAHFGQTLLYWFFKPVNAAVRATQIGEAMIEVTARGSEFSNGDTVSTGRIIQYSDAYEKRQALISHDE
jgi:hypothetical protein